MLGICKRREPLYGVIAYEGLINFFIEYFPKGKYSMGDGLALKIELSRGTSVKGVITYEGWINSREPLWNFQ